MKKPSTLLKLYLFIFLFLPAHPLCAWKCASLHFSVHVYAHACVAINSISHGLACLDLLPHACEMSRLAIHSKSWMISEVCLHLILAPKVILSMQLEEEIS